MYLSLQTHLIPLCILIYFQLFWYMDSQQLNTVARLGNLNTEEDVAGELYEFEDHLGVQWVPGQSGVQEQCKPLSQKKKKQFKKNHAPPLNPTRIVNS